MSLLYHPKRGTILICDYNTGFRPPEMVKRRPVVVISPQISTRGQLCTVVPLSATPPIPAQPYHRHIVILPSLPRPWNERGVWAKCDMVFAASFARLDMIKLPRVPGQSRQYRTDVIPKEDLDEIISGVLSSFGLTHLTKRLL
jgi:mRNA interferase MazF